MVFKDGKVLIGKRVSSHGDGEYGFQGGHLEYLESIEECARREVREETGIEIENIRFLCMTNVIAYAPKHYIDIGVTADWKSGEPATKEPEKVEKWEWFDIKNPPQPLFAMVPHYFEALKTSRNFWDA